MVRIYNVSLKNQNKSVRVKAYNADDAISRAKQRAFFGFRDAKNSNFISKPVILFKIIKDGLTYSVVNTQNNVVIAHGISKNRAEQVLKEANRSYVFSTPDYFEVN